MDVDLHKLMEVQMYDSMIDKPSEWDVMEVVLAESGTTVARSSQPLVLQRIPRTMRLCLFLGQLHRQRHHRLDRVPLSDQILLSDPLLFLGLHQASELIPWYI